MWWAREKIGKRKRIDEIKKKRLRADVLMTHSVAQKIKVIE